MLEWVTINWSSGHLWRISLPNWVFEFGQVRLKQLKELQNKRPIGHIAQQQDAVKKNESTLCQVEKESTHIEKMNILSVYVYQIACMAISQIVELYAWQVNMYVSNILKST